MMPGLFDEQFLLKKLDQKVDPLARLNSIVDWQIFLPIIEKALGRDNASTAGRKPYPILFMFKILILSSESQSVRSADAFSWTLMVLPFASSSASMPSASQIFRMFWAEALLMPLVRME